MLQDERLYALGLCYGARRSPVATAALPARRSTARRSSRRTAASQRDPVRHAACYHVAVRRVDGDDDAHGWLALVHDMSFVARRNEETRQYLFYFFIALGAVRRAHHRRHRPDLVARLGAAACARSCTARASCARPRQRPRRSCARSRATCATLFAISSDNTARSTAASASGTSRRSARRCGASCTATT